MDVSWRIMMRRVARYGQGSLSHERYCVAVEEPLEIRIGDEPLAATMRTPGDDIDLAAGYMSYGRDHQGY